MSPDPIRALVVDDAVAYRKVVSSILSQIPGVEVIGVAANGRIAIDKIELLHPDLITLDLEMPELDGLGVLRHLRSTNSGVKAIMVSAFTDAHAQATVDALNLGAFDFVLKPSGEDAETSAKLLKQELTGKIETFRRTIQRTTPFESPPAVGETDGEPGRTSDDVVRRMSVLTGASRGRPKVVAVGVSTGGPESLAAMLPGLPGNLPVPVLLVQHMPAKFTHSLAESLNGKCQLTVCEAADRMPLVAGRVYIAPGGQQMKVRREGALDIIRVADDPPENSCKPSVDYLFRSVTHLYGARALGVIMTGMGHDGTLGCKLMKRQGATIIAQSRDTCVVYGMPRMVIEAGVADLIAPLDKIADHIANLVAQGQPACT